MNKRFKYGRAFAINSDDSLPVITDSENDKDYFRMLDIVDVLNEQQATIEQLKSVLRKECNIITDDDLLEYVKTNGVSLNE